jgi:DNA-directed RNA polymerase subunit E'/Rpb7
MNGPYYITYIETEVCVPPSQLNSNLKTNIKNTLTNTYKSKCFNDSGYIMDIYSIEKALGDGMMRPEDNTGSVFYNVTFKAKLCNPMKSTTIVGRVEDINKHLIFAKNGPIAILIEGTNINPEKFRYNNIKNALFPLNSEGKEINTPVNTGTYINITIMNKNITPKDNKIMALGKLESLALPEEIKENIKNENSTNDDPVLLEDILQHDTLMSDKTKEALLP